MVLLEIKNPGFLFGTFVVDDRGIIGEVIEVQKFSCLLQTRNGKLKVPYFRLIK